MVQRKVKSKTNDKKYKKEENNISKKTATSKKKKKNNSKKKESKEKYVKICPRCSSINVENDLSRDAIAWNNVARMECQDCGFSSVLFPEVLISEIGKFKEQINSKSEEMDEVIMGDTVSKGIQNKEISRIYLFLQFFTLGFAIIHILIYLYNELTYGYVEFNITTTLFIAFLVSIVLLFWFRKK